AGVAGWQDFAINEVAEESLLRRLDLRIELRPRIAAVELLEEALLLGLEVRLRDHVVVDLGDDLLDHLGPDPGQGGEEEDDEDERLGHPGHSRRSPAPPRRSGTAAASRAGRRGSSREARGGSFPWPFATDRGRSRSGRAPGAAPARRPDRRTPW